jgi:hypothetical protein
MAPINTQAGRSMAPIVTNMAHLLAADRAAMAEYIKSLPGIDAPNAGAPEPNRTPVVRILPTAERGVRSPAGVLAVPADVLASATTVYTVATEPLFLAPAGASPTGAGDGKFLPAAKLAVVARNGNLLQVRVDGWQQAGSDAAFYAFKGQRILVAVLASAASAQVKRGTAIVDPATKLTWFPASLTAWITKDGLNPDIGRIWDYSSQMYSASCGACHAPHPANSYLANQWIGSLYAMKRFSGLDDGQYRLLLAYLQFHAKDALPPNAGTNSLGLNDRGINGGGLNGAALNDGDLKGGGGSPVDAKPSDKI